MYVHGAFVAQYVYFPPYSNDVSTDQPEYCNVNVNANTGAVVQIISSSSDEVSTTEDEPKSKADLPLPPPPPQRKSSISSTSVTSSSPDLNSFRAKEKELASLGGASIPGIPTPGKITTALLEPNLPDLNYGLQFNRLRFHAGAESQVQRQEREAVPEQQPLLWWEQRAFPTGHRQV